MTSQEQKISSLKSKMRKKGRKKDRAKMMKKKIKTGLMGRSLQSRAMRLSHRYPLLLLRMPDRLSWSLKILIFHGRV